MKRKSLAILLRTVSLILVAALMAGCATPAQTPPPAQSTVSATTPKSAPAPAASPAAADPSWPKALSLGAPQASGFNYIAMTSLAVMIQKYLGVTASPEALGGSAPVMNALKSKKVEFGWMQAIPAVDAYNGNGEWTGKAIPEMRILLGGPMSIYPLIVMADSNIKTVPDLKGKKFMFDDPGNSFFKQYVEALLEAHGMTMNDIVPLQWTDAQQVADALFAGTVSAGMVSDTIVGYTPRWLELSKKKPIRFLDIPREKLELVVKKLGPATSIVPLKGGRYEGVNYDILVVNQPVVVAVHKDLPDSLVTKALKVFWDEHPAEYLGFHPSMGALTSKDTIALTNIIPFHPGTIKYYQEKGLWTSELQQMQDKLLAKSK